LDDGGGRGIFLRAVPEDLCPADGGGLAAGEKGVGQGILPLVEGGFEMGVARMGAGLVLPGPLVVGQGEKTRSETEGVPGHFLEEIEQVVAKIGFGKLRDFQEHDGEGIVPGFGERGEGFRRAGGAVEERLQEPPDVGDPADSGRLDLGVSEQGLEEQAAEAQDRGPLWMPLLGAGMHRLRVETVYPVQAQGSTGRCRGRWGRGNLWIGKAADPTNK